MKLAMSPTREKYPLSYKKIIKKTLAPSILILIFVGFLFSASAFFLFVALGSSSSNDSAKIVSQMFAVPVVFLLLYLLLMYLYQRWYFAVYFYDLKPDQLVIRKGPITPSEITIPYERIQDVYVDQDIWDRIFGLFDVHVSSATVQSGMQAHIDGLEKTAADGLKQELLGIITEKRQRK